MKKIKIAIAGVGNCTSSLLQGLAYYKHETIPGVMQWEIGGYTPKDIEVVAAFDVDKRKVGRRLDAAIFAPPNCTTKFCDAFRSSVMVKKGPVLDGVAAHMQDYPEEVSYRLAEGKEVNVVKVLKDSGAEFLLNYLPVGALKAGEYYAGCALQAGCGFINNTPVFIASNPTWEKKFKRAGLPILGDDIKSQLGATVLHRTLAKLFGNRGIKIEKTYQLNIGGNTDFLNMLDRKRLPNKKKSKTEAVQAELKKRLEDENIHVGPSDYVPFQKDNKICYIRIEGKGFGEMPIVLDLKLSVEDSPNSAGIVIDAIRCARIAKERGEAGAIKIPSAFFFKHPPLQITDSRGKKLLERWINGELAEKLVAEIEC